MRIGFTGTRSGMSDLQKQSVIDFIKSKVITKIIHGGCIGADMDFHYICKDYYREVYPGHFKNNPNDRTLQGNYLDADLIHESQSHFKRNRDIVDNCDILIATPYNNNGKGGTWYTINYAKKIGKPIIIFER